MSAIPRSLPHWVRTWQTVTFDLLFVFVLERVRRQREKEISWSKQRKSSTCRQHSSGCRGCSFWGTEGRWEDWNTVVSAYWSSSNHNHYIPFNEKCTCFFFLFWKAVRQKVMLLTSVFFFYVFSFMFAEWITHSTMCVCCLCANQEKPSSHIISQSDGTARLTFIATWFLFLSRFHGKMICWLITQPTATNRTKIEQHYSEIIAHTVHYTSISQLCFIEPATQQQCLLIVKVMLLVNKMFNCVFGIIWMSF